LSIQRAPFLLNFSETTAIAFFLLDLKVRSKWEETCHLQVEVTCQKPFPPGTNIQQPEQGLLPWLALDPFAEEAYRRLMRVYLALGDATAALQVYTTCRACLAQELQVEPSADTVALAEHIRTTSARRPGSRSARSPSAESQPPSDLIAPLVGRALAFTQLICCYQQARLGQPQTVLLVGEAGIGKTRQASEFVGWIRAQGAEVLSGHAFVLGGRLPYQPLVEALRPRLEEENAPEDLLLNCGCAIPICKPPPRMS
jgi:hypothetical protein